MRRVIAIAACALGCGSGGDRAHPEGAPGSAGSAAPRPAPAPPAPPRRIDLGTPQLPAVIAARREDGPWSVLPLAGDHYDVPDLGPRYSIIAVCDDPETPYIELRHLGATDRIDLVVACPPRTRVSMTATFAPDDVPQHVELGVSFARCRPDAECELPPGVHDAYAFFAENDPAAMRVRILRALRVVAGGTFDADASKGFALEKASVTLGLPRGRTSVRPTLCFTSGRGGGAFCTLPDLDVKDGAARLDFLRVPLRERVPGDCDQLDVLQRTVCLRPEDVRVDVPAIVPRGPVKREGRRTTWEAAPDDAAVLLAYGAPYSETPRWTIIATRAWLDGRTSYELPDLSSVPGWQRRWNTRVDAARDIQIGAGTAPLARPVTITPDLWQRLHPGDRIDWWAVR